jgi:hypothetical protein
VGEIPTLLFKLGEDSMSEKFKVVVAERKGKLITRLINAGALGKNSSVEEFFEPDCKDIEVKGTVTITGDTDALNDDSYVSD